MADVTLIVIYTTRLEECRRFYAGLGLDLVPEQHGAGPAHFAAELGGGLVLELYPARPGRETGALRLGLSTTTARGSPVRAPGRHLLTDPDGRTVDLQVHQVATDADTDH
jgi:catechol 2,3-dioxygenase-like lactoylglutathione lyase family enzyme